MPNNRIDVIDTGSATIVVSGKPKDTLTVVNSRNFGNEISRSVDARVAEGLSNNTLIPQLVTQSINQQWAGVNSQIAYEIEQEMGSIEDELLITSDLVVWFENKLL